MALFHCTVSEHEGSGAMAGVNGKPHQFYCGTGSALSPSPKSAIAQARTFAQRDLSKKTNGIGFSPVMTIIRLWCKGELIYELVH